MLGAIIEMQNSKQRVQMGPQAFPIIQHNVPKKMQIFISLFWELHERTMRGK